jgi:hypothetical protein
VEIEMAKKKIRSTYRGINNQTTQMPTPQATTSGPTKVSVQTYDAEDYIKHDIGWTFITAAIVIVVGAILYYIFK